MFSRDIKTNDFCCHDNATSSFHDDESHDFDVVTTRFLVSTTTKVMISRVMIIKVVISCYMEIYLVAQTLRARARSSKYRFTFHNNISVKSSCYVFYNKQIFPSENRFKWFPPTAGSSILQTHSILATFLLRKHIPVYLYTKIFSQHKNPFFPSHLSKSR